jgi:hypothetical protein
MMFLNFFLMNVNVVLEEEMVCYSQWKANMVQEQLSKLLIHVVLLFC